MPAGYIIANVNVTNPEQYDAYRKLSTEAAVAHGAEFVVRGGQQKILEGNLHSRTVVLKFPSFAAAQAYYDSVEYSKARDARAGAALMNMIAVEGA
jgi:uncharacterized protein (DUF1330 family)